MRHELLDIDAVGTRLNHQAGRVLMIGFVADVLHHRQFLLAHLLRDLLAHATARNLERQLGDDDVAGFLFLLPDRARPKTAHALLIKLVQLRARRDDLGTGRQIGPFDKFEQPTRRQLRIIQQRDARRGNLPQIVRRNVGRHANRNA